MNEDYTAAPLGDGLLDPPSSSGGFTAHQRFRGGGLRSPLACVQEFASQHVLALYALWFVAFCIACSGLSKANQALARDGGGAHLPDESKKAGGGKFNHWASRCDYIGDALYGDQVYAYGGHHYQLIGGNWVQETWRSAEADAWGRCYGGAPGYLATINDAGEQTFLHDKLANHPAYKSGDKAWIGANDMAAEGTFTWLDGYMAATPFYKTGEGPLKGMYSNFAEGEPNENGEEDCVEMDGHSGQWNDDNCYKRLQYFFVEFDV
eukprot:CAMPEP_0119259186 /NCGR_PEP_ID=MMETSP1329-20130426/100_1 /TAXON_ID=114041 /ORGANISM="Genus nov. species nov., Strain RCC1024" /LENGTH=263 /DNA_ID=CAMNT_0007258551 /DNA_START=247 /DNA_END=1038 /DNA_ORIENTATION=+